MGARMNLMSKPGVLILLAGSAASAIVMSGDLFSNRRSLCRAASLGNGYRLSFESNKRLIVGYFI